MADKSEKLERVTPEDVEALTEKLKSWITTLPEQEQLVLGWVLTRATAAESAAAMTGAREMGPGVPVSSLMAQAAGLRAPSGDLMPQTIGPITVWKFTW
jgi:hypothetical protein